jgi:hypothetical protein
MIRAEEVLPLIILLAIFLSPFAVLVLVIVLTEKKK